MAPGSAAQFRERHAPDIRAESHQIDEVSIQRRDHEARAGYRDDHIDFIGPQARALQALFRSFAAELHGMLDVFVVCLRKRARLDDVVEGEDGVPLVNLGVIDDAHHRFEAALGNVKDASHVYLHVIARDGVGRERGGRRGDGGIRGWGSFCGSIARGFHQSPWAQSRRCLFSAA